MTNPRHHTDTSILAQWMGSQIAYAIERENIWPPDPSVAVVGHEQDAIITADDHYGDDPERLGWMAGYMAWPCDAVYVCAAVATMAVNEEPTEEGQLERVEMSEEDWDPFLERALMVVAHSIVTNETTAVLFVRKLRDDGIPVWEPYAAPPVASQLYEPMLEAAHEYDNAPPSPVSRMVARDMVRRENGVGYSVAWHAPGCLMNAAREHAGRRG